MSPQPNSNILWFLPTHGDGRYLGTATGGREVNFNYLRQIAQAADQLGCRPGEAARIPGWSRRRSRRGPSGCAILWLSDPGYSRLRLPRA